MESHDWEETSAGNPSLPVPLTEGAKYFDRPVYVEPRPMENSLSVAFGSPSKPAVLVGHERVRLRWMKPDGKGGLVPK